MNRNTNASNTNATAATARKATETLGLPAGSLDFFRALAKDAGNWGGNPWFEGNIAAGRSASGYVGRLVKAGLIRSENNGDGAFAVFTDAGIEAAGKLGIDLTWINAPAKATEAAEARQASAAKGVATKAAKKAAAKRTASAAKGVATKAANKAAAAEEEAAALAARPFGGAAKGDTYVLADDVANAYTVAWVNTYRLLAKRTGANGVEWVAVMSDGTVLAATSGGSAELAATAYAAEHGLRGRRGNAAPAKHAAAAEVREAKAAAKEEADKAEATKAAKATKAAATKAAKAAARKATNGTK